MRIAFSGRLLAGLEQIANAPGDGRWLIEEGSAQRAHVLAAIAVPLETRIAYVEALPVAPLTLCLCLADTETIVARGMRRGRPGLLPSQAPASIEACLWTAGLLEHRGVPVVSLQHDGARRRECGAIGGSAPCVMRSHRLSACLSAASRSRCPAGAMANGMRSSAIAARIATGKSTRRLSAPTCRGC